FGSSNLRFKSECCESADFNSPRFMAVDVWQGVPQPAMEGEPDGEGQKCSRPAKHLPCLAAANGQHGRAKARVGRKARNGNRERRPWVVGVLVVRVVILA